MKYTKKILILLFIFLLSFSIRLYKLESLPFGVHPDEASWGYNAYSIYMTGKDEHGVSYPIIFKAYGDEKLPIYTYATVISVKLFGLSRFSVRFPSVLFGSLIPVVIYFILRKIDFSNSIGFIGAIIAGTSPWLFFLNRVFGYDCTIGLFLFCIALVFLIEVVKNPEPKSSYFILAGLFLALTVYSYTAYRLFSPLVVFILFSFFVRKRKKLFRYIFFLIISFSLVLIPIIRLSAYGGGNARFKQVFLTPFKGMILSINENRAFCSQDLPKELCYAKDNKLTQYSKALFSRYIKAFSVDYLFIEGDKDMPFLNMDLYGNFFSFLLFFYIIGFIYYFNKIKRGILSSHELFVFILLLLSPIPAVLVEYPVKTRLSPLFPFVVIVIVSGIKYVQDLFKSVSFKKYYLFFFALTLFIFVCFFCVNFYTIHLKKYEFYYNNHTAKLVEYIRTLNNKKDFYIQNNDEAIMIFAFLDKTDPLYFQKNVKRASADIVGFSHAVSLGNVHTTKYDIEKIYCNTKDKKNEVFFVSNENLVGRKVKKARKIIYSSNKALKLLFIYSISDLIRKPTC